MDINELREIFSQGKRLKYIFFWGNTEREGSLTKACLSQWYDCKFEVNGNSYHTAEQYMMAQKALLFGDTEIYRQIMKSSHPKQYKELGRKISGFKEELWKENRLKIVIEGNIAKFSQNPELKEFLKATGNRVLAEASPYDRIWGIGMAKDDPNIENPLMWKGMNLLGFALMEAREKIFN